MEGIKDIWAMTKDAMRPLPLVAGVAGYWVWSRLLEVVRYEHPFDESGFLPPNPMLDGRMDVWVCVLYGFGVALGVGTLLRNARENDKGKADAA